MEESVADAGVIVRARLRASVHPDTTACHPAVAEALDGLKTYDETSSNSDLFEDLVKHLVHACLQGESALLLCYGMPQTGKTHTIFGSETEPGIVELALDCIFNSLHHTSGASTQVSTVSLSLYEVSVGEIFNLTGSRLKSCQTNFQEAAMRQVNDSAEARQLINDARAQLLARRAQSRDRSDTHVFVRVCVRNPVAQISTEFVTIGMSFCRMTSSGDDRVILTLPGVAKEAAGNASTTVSNATLVAGMLESAFQAQVKRVSIMCTVSPTDSNVEPILTLKELGRRTSEPMLRYSSETSIRTPTSIDAYSAEMMDQTTFIDLHHEARQAQHRHPSLLFALLFILYEKTQRPAEGFTDSGRRRLVDKQKIASTLALYRLMRKIRELEEQQVPEDNMPDAQNLKSETAHLIELMDISIQSDCAQLLRYAAARGTLSMSVVDAAVDDLDDELQEDASQREQKAVWVTLQVSVGMHTWQIDRALEDMWDLHEELESYVDGNEPLTCEPPLIPDQPDDVDLLTVMGETTEYLSSISSKKWVLEKLCFTEFCMPDDEDVVEDTSSLDMIPIQTNDVTHETPRNDEPSEDELKENDQEPQRRRSSNANTGWFDNIVTYFSS